MQRVLAWLHQAVPRMWLRRGLAARLLWPLSLCYGWLWQRKLARSQLHPATALPVPVLVIGNVIAGGAGKTPVAIAVVRHFVSRGVQVGLISRGYGRESANYQAILVVYPSEHISAHLRSHISQDATQCGDEPLLVHQHTGIPVAVCADRNRAARLLLEACPDIQLLVCDDGLQHVALARQGEVCVLDERGIGNGWLLPAGPLREPWPRAATLVLHSAAPPVDLRYAPGQAVYSAQRSLARHARQADGTQSALQDWAVAGQAVSALAGIAQPQRFFAMLQQAGLVLAHTLALPDHARPPDIVQAAQTLAAYGRPVLCTEKDAVKLWPHLPQVWAVPLLLQPEAAFFDALDQWWAQHSPDTATPSAPSVPVTATVHCTPHTH